MYDRYGHNSDVSVYCFKPSEIPSQDDDAYSFLIAAESTLATNQMHRINIARLEKKRSTGSHFRWKSNLRRVYLSSGHRNGETNKKFKKKEDKRR